MCSLLFNMDSQIADKLSELIKRITETGEWVLDPENLKVSNNMLDPLPDEHSLTLTKDDQVIL